MTEQISLDVDHLKQQLEVIGDSFTKLAIELDAIELKQNKFADIEDRIADLEQLLANQPNMETL